MTVLMQNTNGKKNNANEKGGDIKVPLALFLSSTITNH